MCSQRKLEMPCLLIQRNEKKVNKNYLLIKQKLPFKMARHISWITKLLFNFQTIILFPSFQCCLLSLWDGRLELIVFHEVCLLKKFKKVCFQVIEENKHANTTELSNKTNHERIIIIKKRNILGIFKISKYS